MNYPYIYFQLVCHRLENPLPKLDKDDPNYVYTEDHHIIPKAEGGPDSRDNMVAFTAREHYVAHLLLGYIYNDSKMWRAVLCMRYGHERGPVRDFRYNSHLYQKAREEYSKSIRGEKHWMYGKKPWNTRFKTEEQYNEIKELYEIHKSSNKVAKILETDGSTILKILHNRGVNVKNYHYIRNSRTEIWNKVDEIISLREKGLTIKELSDKFNISETQIGRMTNKIKKRNRKYRDDLHTPEKINFIRELAEQGKTEAEIARACDCTRRTISLIRKEHGIQIIGKYVYPTGRLVSTRKDLWDAAEDFKKLYDNGMSLEKIAKKYNTDRHLIRKIINHHQSV